MASPPDPMSMDRPWVGSYPPGVPPTYRLPAVRLPRLLDDAARDFPDHVGVVVGRTELTFGGLRDNVVLLDRALGHQGIQDGDRILVMLPTGVSLFIVLVALWRRGATVVPVPDDADPEQIAEVATDMGVVAVIGTQDAVASLRRQQTPSRVAIVVTGSEWDVSRPGLRLPRLPRLPWVRVRRARPGNRVSDARRRSGRTRAADVDDRATGTVVITSLTDLLVDAARAAAEPLDTDAPALEGSQGSARPAGPTAVAVEEPTVDGPALIAVGLGPSGVTTVEHTHRTLLATAFHARLWVPDIQAARERMLVAEPLHDIVGLAVGLLSSVLSGATTILLDDPSPSDLARAIERHRPTLLVARSRRVARLLDDGDAARRDLTSLRVALAIGEGLPPAVAQDLEERSGGARFRTVRGCGDAAPLTHGQPVYGRVIPTAMGLPLTDTLAVVVDPEDWSRSCAVDEPGLLLVRGPQIPEIGAGGVDGRTADGWLVTRNVARVDADGWFTILGDPDELVFRSGDAVPARRLTEALCRRPDVRDAEVVVIDDLVVGAVISTRRRPPHPEDLLAGLRTEFDDRALPDRILLVTEFPRTATDTLDRARLEEKLRDVVQSVERPAGRADVPATDGGKP